MWFGNTISYQWWGDLGIDEGICTFLAHLAMSLSPKLARFNQAAWLTFLEYKYWGIGRDNFSSCHSITQKIDTTERTEILYDGTAYGKCTAFIKQLYKVMGHETLSNGFKLYFKRYSFKNTTQKHLVECLQEAFDQSMDTSMGPEFNLKAWFEQWINTSGMNILEPIIESENGKLTSLKIKQGLGLRG